ncbi:MAG: flippase-like domain-containing protein [Burkholderiaceae bacterium]|nr:flippase-like domain-containing protein [Burkholderiaceae bacterium]
MSTRRRRAGWGRVAAAAALVAAIFWWADPAKVWQEVAGADPVWLLAGLTASTLANIISALRWRALASWLGHVIGVREAAGIYFRGVAINALLPGAVLGGDVYRAVALHRRGQLAMEASLSVLLDRLSGLWMLIVLGVVSSAWGVAGGHFGVPVPEALRVIGSPLLALAAALLLVAPVGAVLALRLMLRAQSRGTDDNCAEWLVRAALIVRHHGAVRQYALQLVASLAVQLLSIGAFGFAGLALGIDLPLWVWAAVAVPVFLMATLPVSFGGWGTREAGAVLALAMFAVPAAPAVGASVVYGLFALVQAVFGGALLAAGGPRSAP